MDRPPWSDGLYNRVDVYLDESGDLGFSTASSKHLVVVALATGESFELRRLTKKARNRFRPARKGVPELKFNVSTTEARRFILSGLSRLDCRIAWTGVRKAREHIRTKSDKEKLMNSLFGAAVSSISRETLTRSMNIVVDRRRIKDKLRDEFDRQVGEAVLVHHCGFLAPSLEISHLDSMTCAGLQTADFVAGAVFRKLERGDGNLLALVADKVVHGELR